MNWWVIGLTFMGVNLDFFFVLICLLKQYRTRDVLIGYLVGVILLVIISFSAGQFLSKFIPEWILGILGILPIWMALHDEDDKVDSRSNHLPVLTVLLTYLAVCSGCNLSIFLPVLVGVSVVKFLEILVFVALFTVMIVIVIKLIGQISTVDRFMNRYSETLMKVVYIGVGIYVFFDSGLIHHLVRLI